MMPDPFQRNYLELKKTYLRLKHIVKLAGDDSVRLADAAQKFAGVRNRIEELAKHRLRLKSRLVLTPSQSSYFAVTELPVSMLMSDPKPMRTDGALAGAALSHARGRSAQFVYGQQSNSGQQQGHGSAAVCACD